MNTTFKKSLLALALAGFASSALASSGEIDVSLTKGTLDADVVGQKSGAFAYGNEYLANLIPTAAAAAADFETRSFIQYKAPVAIGLDHSLKFDLTGGALSKDTDMVLLDTTNAVVAELIDFVADGNGNYTSVTFKVVAATIATDDVVFFSTATDAGAGNGKGVVKVVPNSGVGSDVTIALTQAKDASALELNAPKAGPEILVTRVNQFTDFSIARESTQVDVEANREMFVVDAPGTTTTTKTADFSVTINPVDQGIDVALSSFNVTLEDTLNAAAITAVGNAALTGNDWTDTVGDLTNLVNFTSAITVSGTDRIEVGNYSYTVDIDPSDVNVATFKLGSGVGHQWSLNAGSAFIPYMPYGPNISQIIYLTNKGAQVGDITVSVRNQAGDLIVTDEPAGVTTENGITYLTAEILDLVTAAGVTNEKVSIEVTANIPEGDMEVYSAYNVSGNRVTVINNSQVTTNR